jgi:hypothetical protein
MKNAFLTLLAMAGSLAVWSGPVQAQILTNGGFETDSATIGTGKVQTGFSTITGWQNIGTAANNSGVQYGTPGEGLNFSQSGSYFAFQDSDDGNGTNLGAYQITSTTLNTGDQITLTWYAESSYQSPVQTVHLLDASSTGSSYASATILTPTNSPSLTLTSTYVQYTLTYTATASDVGKFLGVSFATTGATNSFAQYDNFVLTDVASVPEPATYALLLAGLGGLLLIKRARFV